MNNPTKLVRGEYLGNPGKVIMGCIYARSLKEKMIRRKIDVAVVDLSKIFPTNHDREMFPIQGEVIMGIKLTPAER
jgi:hypothetical protein